MHPQAEALFISSHRRPACGDGDAAVQFAPGISNQLNLQLLVRHLVEIDPTADGLSFEFHRASGGE
jgi:hypothetical protein